MIKNLTISQKETKIEHIMKNIYDAEYLLRYSASPII